MIIEFQKLIFFNESRRVSIQPNSVWNKSRVPKIYNEENLCYSLSGKKVRFSNRNLRNSRLTNFKNRSFSSDEGFIQIKRAQYVSSIPCLFRVWNKNYDCFPGKKNVFHTEFWDYFKNLILKNSIFHRVKKLSKSNHTRYGVCHVYLECRTKLFFAIGCLGKK